MARRNVTVTIDDLTGKQLPEGKAITVRFALNGANYEIDLDKTGAEKFRAVFEKYTAAGRRTAPNRKAQRPQPTHVRTAASSTTVRAWAAANGIGVSDRGRIPAAVVSQFEAAGN